MAIFMNRFNRPNWFQFAQARAGRETIKLFWGGWVAGSEIGLGLGHLRRGGGSSLRSGLAGHGFELRGQFGSSRESSRDITFFRIRQREINFSGGHAVLGFAEFEFHGIAAAILFLLGRVAWIGSPFLD